MIFEVSLWLLGIAGLLSAVWGVVRYSTPLNPLTFFVALEMGVTIFSGIITYTRWPLSGYSENDLADVSMISLIYLIGTTLPFLCRGPHPSRLFGLGIRALGLGSKAVARNFRSLKLLILMLCSICAFWALAIVGGGGTLWLTDSRFAYQVYRAGAGGFFALTQWFMLFAFLYCLWSLRPRKPALIFLIFVFSGLAYFTGSKGNILIVPITGLFWYHFRVRKVSLSILSFAALALFFAFLCLQTIQGTALSWIDTLEYFNDYFRVTTMFVARIEEFGFRYGSGTLSSFWSYVPRALYPDKPYEYGYTLIHQVLFPGLTETGNTPGVLPWSLAYLDFGILGAFLFGVANGLWRRAAYEYFLENRDRFFAFFLMVHVALFSILPYATFGLLIVWCVIQNSFFRLNVRVRSTQ